MTDQETFKVIRIDPGSCGLGDMIWMAGEAQRDGKTMFLVPSKAISIAPVLMGMIPVMVDVSDDRTQEALPIVKLSDREIELAKAFLERYQNPIAVCVNCSPHWAYLREVPIDRWQPIMDKLKSRFSLIQFGVSDHFIPIPGAVHLTDYPIRHVAACYKLIGSYVGVETGNTHLMMAVGGKCWVAEPAPCPERDHKLLHYNHPKCRYYDFSEMEKIAEDVA